MNEDFHVTGTLMWYYKICRREAWLMAHQILPDEDDANVDYGRFLHEHVYRREKKEVTVGHLKLDIVKASNQQVVIGEVKKSSAASESSRTQLLFYLYELKQMGISAIGELRYPEERGKETVVLTDDEEQRIEDLKRNIYELAQLPNPPKVEKVKWCKNCAYRESCWA